MVSKKPALDDATIRVVRQVLAMPPTKNEDLKVGRPKKKKRGIKGRASSAKRRTA